MTLFFGLELDDHALPHPPSEAGIYHCGRRQLLRLLENFLGLAGLPDNIDFLRVEQYRQALLRHLASPHPAPDTRFYKASFEADQFATAENLLERRDELLLNGWDFSPSPDMPPRLRAFAEIETLLHQDQIQAHDQPSPGLSQGFSDRFCQVLASLDQQTLPFSSVKLNEPLDLLPRYLQRLFDKMSAAGASIGQLHAAEQPPVATTANRPLTDLQKFQKRLFHPSAPLESGDKTLSNDGSLLLLRSKRSGDAAAWLARLLRINQQAGKTPSVNLLIPESSRELDVALVQEGQPSLGLPSASLARPALQILKLVPAFLWEPVDPYKLLEFVSLSAKPLPEDLSARIAAEIASTPGMRSDKWREMISTYFSELEQKAADNRAINVAEVRKQYHFWFERTRHKAGSKVPKDEIAKLYHYVFDWAYRAYEEYGNRNTSFLVLREQARRTVELLETLPESELSHLELERIVRTIFEAAPVVLQEEEAGHLPYASHPASFTGPVPEIWWWNFLQQEAPHFFSRWYQQERDYLAGRQVLTDTPELENARMLWQQRLPVRMARERLLLVIPDAVIGEAAVPHPLFGDLLAAFENLEAITQEVSLDQPQAGRPDAMSRHFALPELCRLELRQTGRPKPFLKVRNLGDFQRDYESLTSLETLIYYPYLWVFRYKLRLRQSPILSIVPEHTLMGNLAHRLFEKLLKEDYASMDRPSLERWIDQEMQLLLMREGTVLLLYGREPDRIQFANKLKYAAWSLIQQLRANGWRVLATEQAMDGTFPVYHPNPDPPPIPVKGIADLVLERDNGELAVLDFKWRSSDKRMKMIKNEEDLQLAFYSRLASKAGEWAHTAYFIVEKGEMLARNKLAFRDASAVAPDKDYREVYDRIFQKMEATWLWRMGQLRDGLVEVRSRQTMQEIEDYYSESGQAPLLLDLLEMKGDSASFDEYKKLLGLSSE
ncbi:MAG: hypothetical protein RI973_759 [Bacteroidota bacterium]|jgi:RecB family exonuclease